MHLLTAVTIQYLFLNIFSTTKTVINKRTFFYLLEKKLNTEF